MTGFEFYERLLKNREGVDEKPLDDAELAQLVAGTKKSIRANCGELRRFSNPKARAALLVFLAQGGVFETTFGKLVYGDDSGTNTLLADLARHNYLGGKAKCYYTTTSAVDQIFFGSTHAIVFDDGEKVFVERPHGPMADSCQIGLLLDDEKELADAFGNFTNQIYDFHEIRNIDDAELIKNTLKRDDPRWDEEVRFGNRQEFMQHVLSTAMA